jgi:hypothetical protein
VSITRCLEAVYPQAPSQNTGVGGAFWRGTNGWAATPPSTQCKAMLEKHVNPLRKECGQGIENHALVRPPILYETVGGKCRWMRAVQ